MRTSRLLAVLPVLAVAATACGGGGGGGSAAAAAAKQSAAIAAAEKSAATLTSGAAATASTAAGGGAAASADPAAQMSSAEAALASALSQLPGSSATSSSGSAAAAPPAGSASAVSLRFVNLYFTTKKQAGPAIDIYDTEQGQAAKPLVAGLAYGAVSSYVHPQAKDGVSRLYALPAGEDPVAKQTDAQGLNALQDDGSHPQETIRINGDPTATPGAPLAGLNFSTILEKGSDNGTKGPVAPLPGSGKGEILADKSAFTALGTTDQEYLMIDALCAPPLNGEKTLGNVPYIFAVDAAAPQSSFAVFATAPGTHKVSVDIESPTAAPTCAQLTKKQSPATVNVADGQQVLAFLYGTSPTAARLVFAPIAP